MNDHNTETVLIVQYKARPGPSSHWEEQKASVVAEDHDLLTGGKKIKTWHLRTQIFEGEGGVRVNHNTVYLTPLDALDLCSIFYFRLLECFFIEQNTHINKT